MNLKAIREQFISASGRSDLIEPNGANKGADWFINQGQRMLDLAVNLPQVVRHYNVVLQPGEYQVLVPLLRSVDEVWVTTETTSRKPLSRLDLSELRYAYRQIQSESGDSLQPRIQTNAGLTYAGGAVGFAIGLDAAPTQDSFTNTRSFGDNDGLQIGHISKSMQIIIAPPAMEISTLWIKGRFWSADLTQDGDSSVWTLLYENTLLQAALYQLEVFYRNTEGAKDWLRAIEQTLNDIEVDSAMREQGFINQMEG